jgi:Ca2+-binding EF-hand superfamily protein
MYQHWRTCFELLDEDGSKAVSKKEFETLGFLFGFSAKAVSQIYKEFDVDGNAELDVQQFHLFVIAAIDMREFLAVNSRVSARVVGA